MHEEPQTTRVPPQVWVTAVTHPPADTSGEQGGVQLEGKGRGGHSGKGGRGKEGSQEVEEGEGGHSGRRGKEVAMGSRTIFIPCCPLSCANPSW